MSTTLKLSRSSMFSAITFPAGEYDAQILSVSEVRQNRNDNLFVSVGFAVQVDGEIKNLPHNLYITEKTGAIVMDFLNAVGVQPVFDESEDFDAQATFAAVSQAVQAEDVMVITYWQPEKYEKTTSMRLKSIKGQPTYEAYRESGSPEDS